MPEQPEPIEREYQEEKFEIVPVTTEPGKDDRRHVTERKEILKRRPFGLHKYGEATYFDTTGAEFKPTGKKDEYERVGEDKRYTRDRTKYG